MEQTLSLEQQDRSPETVAVQTLERGPRISHAVLLTAAQLSRGLFRMLFVIIVARALGPAQFGIYVLLFATVEMISVASGFGYMDYLTRESATDEGLGWGLCLQLTCLRVGFSVVLGVMGVGTLNLLGYHRLILIACAWFCVTLIPRSITETVQGVLRGTSRQFAFLIVELAVGLVLLAAAALLLVSNRSLGLVILSEIVANTIGALFALSFALRCGTRRRTFTPIRELLRVSIIFNIYAFVTNLYDRLDVVLLSRLAGNYACGIYGAAYRPLGAVQLLPYGIFYSLLPSLSAGGWSPVLQEKMKRAMTLLLDASLLIVLLAMVFGDAAIRFGFGSDFAEAATAVKILIWAVIFRYLNYGFNIGLLAVRKERIFVFTSLVCLTVNVLGNLWLIPVFSWRGAAILTVVTEMVLLIQNILWCRATLGSALLPRATAGTMVMFLLCVGVSLAGKAIGTPILIGAACLISFVVYLYRQGTMADLRFVWAN